MFHTFGTPPRDAAFRLEGSASSANTLTDLMKEIFDLSCYKERWRLGVAP
jgi:hypothetical protein